MDYKHFLYEEFPVLLRDLKADTPALWGKMNAQQMIEHLYLVVSASNGRVTIDPQADEARLAYRKMRFFEKDTPMPRHFRVIFVPEEPNPVQFVHIEDAKMKLFEQLQRFDDYFMEHPCITSVHPVFGALNYEEWVQNHARHIRHHLMQFGLIEIPVEN
jgi:hydroxymethylglutaryl-CoA reductase